MELRIGKNYSVIQSEAIIAEIRKVANVRFAARVSSDSFDDGECRVYDVMVNNTKIGVYDHGQLRLADQKTFPKKTVDKVNAAVAAVTFVDD